MSGKETVRNGPGEILRNMMAIRYFSGVPVLILDMDAVPEDLKDFKAYVRKQIKNGFEAHEKDTSRLMRLFQREADSIYTHVIPFNFRSMTFEQSSKSASPAVFGLPSRRRPAHKAGRDFYKPASAAIVLAPGQDIGPDNAMTCLAGLSREGLAPLAKDATIWRYQALCHELGHVAAGLIAEPQADTIAALFCRRAFPDAIEPQIQTDIRAIDAIRLAYLLSEGEIDPNSPIDQMLMGSLQDYGWPMVTAGDAVMTIPQKVIEKMTDEDIIEKRFERFDHSVDKILELGKLIRNAHLGDLIAGNHINDVAKGAALLEKKIHVLTDEPLHYDMAKRFSMAASRLAKGKTAYAATHSSQAGQLPSP